MTSDPLFAAVLVLIAAGLAWLALVWKLFGMMKIRTPEAYAAIGSPHVVFNNTLSNNLLFVRFLLGGQYGNVGDVGVRRLCAFLRVFFWLYVTGAAAFAVVMLGILHA